jgi:small-conductance mechanosensitive channel/CRP-like cAMP-binding protein
MHPAHYWFAAAVFAGAIAFWRPARDRSRPRAALGLLALWAASWIASLLPVAWRPGDATTEAVAIALIELAAIQIAVVLIFDLLLRRVRVTKLASESLILAAYAAVVFNLFYKVGVNVTGIFATSAVVAAIAGFALQDMLSNIAGGIALELEGGIKAGDFIHCGPRSGWVKHVRLRHTAITSPNGETIILPNSELTRTAVTICSRSERRLIPFAAPYARDPQELIAAVEFALRSSPIPGIARDPAPSCVVRAMAPGHIEYAAVVWFSNPGHDVAEISSVITRIYFALRRAGIPATEISTLVEMKSESNVATGPMGPVDVLRRTPILRLLCDPDLTELASHLKPLSFAQGEYIIRQGERGDSMYFIVEGRVGISFHSNGAGERQVAVMEPGEFFGESSLLTGEPRNANGIALTRVDCYRLDKAGLEGFVRRLPDLAEDMSVVMAHRQLQLDSIREKLDRETALRREAESQTQFLSRIRRFFEE